MRKSILTSLALIFTLSITFGQNVADPAEENNLRHSLGVGAGFTTGIGMSYRYSFNRFKIQATFAPISDNYSVNYHAGLTALYSLIDAKNTIFYLYQGNYFHYEKYKNYNSFYGVKERIRRDWNHGLGIGIEFIILKRIGFNLMGGYALYDSFDRIGITGETGLYYMF